MRSVSSADQETAFDTSRAVFQIGQYAVFNEVGRGGMGVVYEAWDTVLDRRTAVKVLAADRFSADQLPELIARQLREAQMAARVSNPHLVSVYTAGSTDGHNYIAMEFVPGRSLKAVLEDGPLELAKALAYVRYSAVGLGALHKNGIIHRDIKPANILLDEQECVRVTDFGLAKPVQEESGLSLPGLTVGTIPYISPEQCQGRPADERSDLFALGVTFYELLTGCRPFHSKSVRDLSQEFERFSLTRCETNGTRLPAAVQRLLGRMLATNPDERFQSCDEFITALDGCAHELGLPIAGLGTGHPQPRANASKPQVLLLNALVLCGFFALLLALGHQQGGSPLSSLWYGYANAGYKVLPGYAASQNAVVAIDIPGWPPKDDDLKGFQDLGEFLEFLAQQQPAVLVLDFLLDKSSRLKDPAALAEPLKNFKRVVVATDLLGGEEVLPVEAVREAGAKTGSSLTRTDYDGMLRRPLIEVQTVQGDVVPSLALAAATEYSEAKEMPLKVPGSRAAYHFGGIIQPLNTRADNLRSPFLAKLLRDHIVLLGSSGSTADNHVVPVQQGTVPGMNIQALALNNLIDGAWVYDLWLPLRWFIALILGGVAFAGVRVLGTAWIPTILAGCGAASMVMALLLMRGHYLFPAALTVLFVLSGIAAGAAAKLWRSRKK